MHIRFVVFKVETATPRVRVFDLGPLGGRVGRHGWGLRFLYMVPGCPRALVPPGLYLCHIDLGAAAGEDVAVRPVAVIY